MWTIGNRQIGIIVCFADDVLWGDNTEFKDINKLKQTFQIGAEHNQVFICMGMYFMIFLQYSIMILQYSSITIHQKESIDRMSEIK